MLWNGSTFDVVGLKFLIIVCPLASVTLALAEMRFILFHSDKLSFAPLIRYSSVELDLKYSSFIRFDSKKFL